MVAHSLDLPAQQQLWSLPSCNFKEKDVRAAAQICNWEQKQLVVHLSVFLSLFSYTGVHLIKRHTENYYLSHKQMLS